MRQDLKLQLINDEHLILLVEDRKEIVDFIHGDIQHSPVHIPSIASRIMSIFVSEEHRRQGIGGEMVREICDFFRINKAGGVTLRYVLGNSEGEKFWQSCGFEPILITAGAHLGTIAHALTIDKKRLAG